MNSSGYNLDNLHNGDTFIENGSLFVDGQIIAEGATGQTEYLDSGTYSPVFSNLLNINSVDVKTANNQETIFTKNGNVVSLSTNLDINYPAINNPQLTIFRFSMTVPSSLDVFDAKMLNIAPCVTGSTEFGIVLTGGFYVSEGVYTIQLQARNLNIVSTNSALSLKLVYKLEGDDVPATAIVTSGGGGTGGDVRNPMEENLDGGGFNITNIQDLTAQGTVTANSIVAPNVITNPLNSDLNLNGNLLQNSAGSTANIQINPANIIVNGDTIIDDDLIMSGEIRGTNSVTGLILNSNGTNNNIYVRGGEFVIDNTLGLSMNGNLLRNSASSTANIQLNQANIIVNGDTIIDDDLIMSGEIRGTNSVTGLILNSNGANNNIYVRGGEFAIDNTLGLSMQGRLLSNVNIIQSNTNDITIRPLIGGSAGNLNIEGNFTNIQSNFGLKMNTKLISDCSTIKSDNSDLTIIASTLNSTAPANIILSGNRVDLSASNGIDMLEHDINNCGALFTKNINNVKIIRTESDFNGSTNLSGVYHIYGQVSLNNEYTLTGDTSLIGIGGRDLSSLDFDLGGPNLHCINNNDHNLEILNLNFSNTSGSAALLYCSNTSKDKILTITNSSFRDCNNDGVIDATGFDLIDLNQVLFQYNLVSKHVYFDSGSKLQISSCEFLRQANRTLTTFGTAPMITIAQTTTNWGAINISGNLIHPQQTQDGVNLGTITPTEAVISSNTFISVGLTTGQLINYTAGDINNYPSLIVSDNSGVKNQKALLSASSQNNTTYTATVLNTFVPVDFGPTFVVGNDDRFSPTLNAFEFKYDANQPISCLVSVSVSADQDTKGDDTIVFALEQNTVNASEYQVSIGANDVKSFTFTTVLTLVKNDVLRFVVKNETAGTDPNGFRALSFISTLVEI
jgi:hypothetical protein